MRELSRVVAFSVGVFLAAATAGIAAAEVRGRDHRFVPAVTEAPDQLRSVPRPYEADDSQAPEPALRDERFLGSLVVALLYPGRPADVSGLIVSVVLDPIKAVFRAWSMSDVGQERAEILAPFLAHFNASARVVFRAAPTRIATALPHPDPDLVFRCVRCAVAEVVPLNGIPVSPHFSAKTPATRGMAGGEVSGPDNYHRSAIAAATPARHGACVLSSIQHDQATEPHAGAVNKGGHLEIISASGPNGEPL